MSANIVTITPENVDELLTYTETPIIIDLWAPWCAPCKVLSPVLDGLAKNNNESIIVGKLNVDDFPELMQRFRVRGIPTLILYQHGNEIARDTGAKSQAQLMGWLENQGVTLTPSAVDAGTSTYDEKWPWLSFYNDVDLYTLLTERYRLSAQKGMLSFSSEPFWIESRGSASAAFTNNEDIVLFSRLSGLPASFGLLLNLICPDQNSSMDAFFSALQPGLSIGHVASEMMATWISHVDVSGEELASGGLPALRDQWVEYYADDKVSNNQWTSLYSKLKDALQLTQPEQHLLTNHLATVLGKLSPPPSPDDHHNWLDIVRHLYWTQIQLLQDKLGWTREERALPDQRLEWFEQKAVESVSGTLADEEITLLQQEWSALFPSFITKENDFNKNFTGYIDNFRHELLKILLMILKKSK